MGKHPLDGVPPTEEQLERAAAAIVRQWSGSGVLGDWTGNGVTIEEARAAVERNFAKVRQLGPELASAQTWADEPPAPRVIDLDAAERSRHPQLWHLYDDHGALVFGRVEGVLSGWRGRVA